MKLQMIITKEELVSELYDQYSEINFCDDKGEECEVVNLYPHIQFEEWEGFGGAITDAAAYVYAQLNPEQKRELLNMYFSPEKMNYNIVRIHIDSCDFCTSMYEADSDPQDKNLSNFDFTRTEKYIIPMLKDAEEVSGKKLQIMLSPWSPPAFMKTNNSRVEGGSLKKEYYGLWARYICRYIKEFQKRGFYVKRISLQNEPKAIQSWDSCTYTAQEEKMFLKDAMYLELKKNLMDDIEIFIWDHNKERAFERVNEIVDESTEDMIAGVACHWYSGDHFENLDLIRKQFPKMKLIISESCIEFSKYEIKDTEKNAMRLSHEIIGDMNHGVTAFYDWNLLLDEQGGPNHVGNYCLAPFLYNRKNKNLEPQLIQKHFYHFSHYIRPGAIRVASSKYSSCLDVVAYKNPDNTLIVIILNEKENNQNVNFRLQGKIARVEIPGKSIFTGVISDIKD